MSTTKSETGYKKVQGKQVEVKAASMHDAEQTPRKMAFVSRIRGARDVHHMTAREFAQEVQNHRGPERKGDPNFTLQEHFNGETMVHPYYDYDAKYKVPFASAEARQLEEDGRLADFKDLIEKLHPGAEVVYAQRHGELGKSEKTRQSREGKKSPGKAGKDEYVWKISLRAWILGIKVLVKNIPNHARAILKLGPKEVHPYLDLSVYKDKEQLLGVVYGCKDIDAIPRYLKPLDTTEPLSKYLAQNYDEADTVLVVAAPQGGIEEAVTKTAKRGRPKKIQPVVAEAQVGGSTVSEAADGKETLTPANHPNCATVLKVASTFFGGKYRMQENLKSILVNREKNCLIFPTTEKWCFIKESKHDGNNPYIVVTDGGSRWKCPDDLCKQTEVALIPTVSLPKEIRDIFTQTFYAFVDNSLMTEAKVECRKNITDNFPDETPEEVDQVQNTLLTLAKRQTCKKCGSPRTHFEHHSKGYCIRCLDCTSQWPNGLISFPEDGYPKLVAALTQLNIAINITNNVTNVNTIITESQIDFYADFSSDQLLGFDDQNLNTLFVGSLQGTDTGLSRFTTEYFKNEFHCTDERKQWYQFREGEHCWSDVAAELHYKEAMARPEFLRHFQLVAIHFETLPIQNDETKRKARMVRKLCIALEDGKQREKVVQDSIVKFHSRRPNFAKELNTQNILIFEDGVYDFDTHTFGPGSPDVAATMRVAQPYVPYDPSCKEVVFLMEFMSNLLPDPAVRDYMLKVMGICLTLDTSLQLFWVLTGTGSNGKGRLMNLLEECLGPLYQAVSPAMLTRRRESANEANEALMALVKARLAVFQEPESGEVIQAGTVKAITGEDTLSSRVNYGKQTKFRPKFKSFLVANDLPATSESTIALFRRFRIIHFPTAFVEDPKQPHERKIDYNLDKKLKECAKFFIGILIYYYRRYQNEGLQEPKSIKDSTKKYHNENDLVKGFIEEYLVREPDFCQKWTELKPAFDQYCKDSGRKISVKLFRSELEKHGVVYIHTHVDGVDFKGVKGWKLREALSS